MRGYIHERIHQCIRCSEFVEEDSYCAAGLKDVFEPKKLRYCIGFKKKAVSLNGGG